ncbi:hypothetical protein CMO96_01440 [Candidatus Woesebacteria bacterium]|nr:hypothetical protein [Candidatus Woesebacteria bacterium]
MQQIEFRVESRHGPFTFKALVHSPVSLDQFHLAPLEFYARHGGEVPSLPHHELEITEPGNVFFEQRVLHVHPSRKNQYHLMVCYPQRIASHKDALGIFRTWCLGTVLTIVEEIDLNTILGECDNDHALMEKKLLQRFAIKIEE